MISGPQTYAKLSSVAKEFLKRKYPITRPKVVEYEYVSAGSNLSPKPEIAESGIHNFLSQTALTKNVAEEFGKAIDILG